ncbi:Paxneb protein-related protein, partial [Prunus dulcis]
TPVWVLNPKSRRHGRAMRATALVLSPPPLSTRTPLLLLHSPHPLLPFRSLKPKPLPKHRLVLSRPQTPHPSSSGPTTATVTAQAPMTMTWTTKSSRNTTPCAAAAAVAAANGEEDIAMVQSKSFVFTQGWDSEMVVDYRINEDEFHKISLLDCDFFIRKPPDPDNDVYDFREYIRCAKSDFSCYNVTEPPIDAPRDPLYKSERDVLKVYLTKHYRNRRLGDPDFVLDFEEIYVIDSKTKSISRAKVLLRSTDTDTDTAIRYDTTRGYDKSPKTRIRYVMDTENPTKD